MDGVARDVGLVPSVSFYGAGGQHAESADHKQQAFRVLAGQEVAGPLYDFAEVVGGAHVLKQEPSDNDVFGLLSLFLINLLLGFLQHGIRLDIDPHAERKHGHPDGLHPSIDGMVGHRPHTLQVPIREGEAERRHDDLQGHFGCGFEGQWVDDVAVQVVHCEEHKAHCGGERPAEQEVQHPQQVRNLEEEPGQPGVQVDLGDR